MITGRRFKRLFFKKACIGAQKAFNPLADALDITAEGNLPDIHEEVDDDQEDMPWIQDDLEPSEEQLLFVR